MVVLGGVKFLMSEVPLYPIMLNPKQGEASGERAEARLTHMALYFDHHFGEAEAKVNLAEEEPSSAATIENGSNEFSINGSNESHVSGRSHGGSSESGVAAGGGREETGGGGETTRDKGSDGRQDYCEERRAALRRGEEGGGDTARLMRECSVVVRASPKVDGFVPRTHTGVPR